MNRSLPTLALPLLLAACTATGTAGVSPPGASAKPQAGASAKPGASAAPSGAPVAAGESTVSLTIAGKPVTLDGPVAFTNTDIMGKRLRIGAAIGEQVNAKPGHGAVTFLFGGGGQPMFPGWDVTNPGAVYSVQVFYVDPDANMGRTYVLDTSKNPKSTLEAANGRIKGKFDDDATASSGSASVPATVSPVVLTFELVQPPL